jgi:hypothetical protein
MITIAVLLATTSCDVATNQPALTTSLPPRPAAMLVATSAPAPRPAPIWSVLFAGAPCAELNRDCTASMNAPTYYYSINSDGSNLLQIETVPELAGLVKPPVPIDAPSPTGWPQLSPDGASLVYYAYYTKETPSGLYAVDIDNGKASLLLSSKSIPDSPGLFYPDCWSPDGTAIRFYVRFQDGQERRDTFYSVSRDGTHLKQLFTLENLADTQVSWAINSGTCSPDGREVAFSLYPDPRGSLYVLNLDSGQWRQVLADYGVYRLITKDFIAPSKQ